MHDEVVASHAVTAGGIRLAYETSGRVGSPPMVLLHALGERRASWAPVMTQFAGRFGVTARIMVDLTGPMFTVVVESEYRDMAHVAEMTAHGDVQQAMRVGAGAAQGRLYGILAKLFFGIVIGIIMLVAAFPYSRNAPQSTNAIVSTTR